MNLEKQFLLISSKEKVTGKLLIMILPAPKKGPFLIFPGCYAEEFDDVLLAEHGVYVFFF